MRVNLRITVGIEISDKRIGIRNETHLPEELVVIRGFTQHKEVLDSSSSSKIANASSAAGPGACVVLFWESCQFKAFKLIGEYLRRVGDDEEYNQLYHRHR